MKLILLRGSVSRCAEFLAQENESVIYSTLPEDYGDIEPARVRGQKLAAATGFRHHYKITLNDPRITSVEYHDLG